MYRPSFNRRIETEIDTFEFMAIMLRNDSYLPADKVFQHWTLASTLSTHYSDLRQIQLHMNAHLCEGILQLVHDRNELLHAHVARHSWSIYGCAPLCSTQKDTRSQKILHHTHTQFTAAFASRFFLRMIDARNAKMGVPSSALCVQWFRIMFSCASANQVHNRQTNTTPKFISFRRKERLYFIATLSLGRWSRKTSHHFTASRDWAVERVLLWLCGWLFVCGVFFFAEREIHNSAFFVPMRVAHMDF